MDLLLLHETKRQWNKTLSAMRMHQTQANRLQSP